MHKITFDCSGQHEKLCVQLEPEAWRYEIASGETLSFVAITDDEEFSWIMSVGAEWVQLWPEWGQHIPEIIIYQNGIQIRNLANG